MNDAELKARLQALIDTYVQEERAAVVAWLRGPTCGTCCAAAVYALADTIERGEHRREEEP